MLRRAPLLIASIVALVICPSAQAQITLGQLAPPNPPNLCTSGPADLLQVGVSSGAGYVAPTAGVITSWSTNAGPGLVGQTLKFKVFRPLGGTSYSVVGHTGPFALQPSVLNTFPASIPVQAGDLIGVNDQNATAAPVACIFAAGPGDVYGGAEPQDAADGSTTSLPPSGGGIKLNLTASLLPPPDVASLTPASGSVKGGAGVVLAGTNFAEVKGVSFGSVPAKSFKVDSEGQITAIAPASEQLVRVAVSVTTVAGTDVAPSTFLYEGCRVPKLAKHKLKAAKKQLRKAGCKVGKVRKTGGVTVKTGKVIKQSAKPGTILAPGSKIAVKLG